MSDGRSAGGLGRLLSRLVLAGVGVVAAPPLEAEAKDREIRAEAKEREDDEDLCETALELAGDAGDAVAGGHTLAVVLEHMDPLEAMHTAATAALSPRVEIRRALGEALTWIFALGGDDVIIDHLSRDEDVEVRFAAVRAAHARLASRGDHAVLHRLCTDPSSFVGHAALLALHGAPPLRR